MATNAAAAASQDPLTNGVESPSPPPLPYSGETNELTFVQVVRLFLRHWHLIGATALAAGLTAALYLTLSVPRTYEASAVLVIVSPPVLRAQTAHSDGAGLPEAFGVGRGA